MRVGSLFSGIGGFDLVAERAGFDLVWFCEIEAFPRKVLAKHWPSVPCYEDVCAVNGATVAPVDVLCAGVPCQDVSVAGKRAGLGGGRTGLFWEFIRIIREMREATDGAFPRFIMLENVPGLLSSNRGRDFHSVLTAMAECGFDCEWRILDSQYFGVPQRRRRVFIVGCLGGQWERAASVLFEPEGGAGDLASGREARAHVAATLRGRSHGAGVNMPGRGGEDDQNLVAYALGSHAGAADGDQTNRSHASGGPVSMNISEEQAFSLRAGRTQSVAVGFQCHGSNVGEMGTLRGGNGGLTGGVPFLAHALSHAQSGMRFDPNGEDYIVAHGLRASDGHHGHSSPRGDGCDNLIAPANTLSANSGGNQIEQNYIPAGGVRRLTPLECEKLQAFPPGWTCLCGCSPYTTAACKCPDSPRYRALGNAVTVSVVTWIMRRLAAVAAPREA